MGAVSFRLVRPSSERPCDHIAGWMRLRASHATEFRPPDECAVHEEDGPSPRPIAASAQWVGQKRDRMMLRGIGDPPAGPTVPGEEHRWPDERAAARSITRRMAARGMTRVVEFRPSDAAFPKLRGPGCRRRAFQPGGSDAGSFARQAMRTARSQPADALYIIRGSDRSASPERCWRADQE